MCAGLLSRDGALLSMVWEDLLFAHWPVDPAVVEARLPDGLTVATYDGDAYLGVVPFVMSDIGPRFLPVGRSFGELNLRTYVGETDQGPSDDAAGGRGVYFFNLDADDPLGVTVARSLFRLPYYRANMVIDRAGDRVAFRSQRPDGSATFAAAYGPDGDSFVPDSGSLEAFLTENYRFYTAADDGRIWYGDIDHPPWELAPAHADLVTNELFDVNGFEHPDGEPLCHFSRRIEVTAGRLHRA
ncbi:MAG: YqjF family protein [Haloglomus sp.]